MKSKGRNSFQMRCDVGDKYFHDIIYPLSLIMGCVGKSLTVVG